MQVHERVEVEETELQAGLSPSTEEHPFSVQEDASSFNVTLQMESTHLLLDAEGVLRVLDADGEALGEEGFNVSADGNDTLRLTGSFNATGAHTLEVELETGEATYTGAIEIRYEAEA